MTNQEILATLKRNEIRTIGDLDAWAEIRQLSRWHALAQLVGEEAADRIFGRLAVRLARSQAATGNKLRPPAVDVIPNPEATP